MQWVRLSHEVLESPSSRRAWIEIIRRRCAARRRAVALLAEGVDRNRYQPCSE